MSWDQFLGVKPGAQGLVLPSIPGFSIPKFAASRVVLQKGWNSVAWRDAVTNQPLTFTKIPSCVVVAEYRQGWYQPVSFTPPSLQIQLPLIQLPPAVNITAPTITLPSAPTVPTVSIPAVSVPGYTVTIPRTAYDSTFMYNWLGGQYPFNADWGFLGITINWIRDALRQAVTAVLYRFYYTFVQAQIDTASDTIQNSVNSVISKIQTGVNQGLANVQSQVQTNLNKLITDVNAASKTLHDNAQAALNALPSQLSSGINTAFKAQNTNLQNGLAQINTSLQNGANDALAKLATYTTQAYNSVVPQLWALLGLPQNYLITPILYKARLDGFDVYAPSDGVVVHFSAIGS